tara:strand:+ start:2105 stop:2941 length:837 start_codon:yes stop_codon:yes gene_type:complete
LKISVIIPTYNRKHTLHRAIDSVLNQTFKPLEIIVVDDGSNDGTGEWVEEIYPSIKYIFIKNSGVSAARNTGVRSANGQWIAFLDSDDEWMPEKLEQQTLLLGADREAALCHTNEIWIRNGVRVNQLKKHTKFGGYIFEKCLDMCRISPSSAILSKKLFTSIGYFDESLKVCEDYDMWLRVAAKHKILFLDYPLITKYGGHRDQLSRVKSGIEKYRIRSLEAILSSKTLSEKQFFTAKHVLIQKLKIYQNGVTKRKRYTELKKVQDKIEYWINSDKWN